ncbi:hypothetical protein Q9966_010254 [Columba livia]|nr:hypothetical protein Q9966_010254 [Columba livia]
MGVRGVGGRVVGQRQGEGLRHAEGQGGLEKRHLQNPGDRRGAAAAARGGGGGGSRGRAASCRQRDERRQSWVGTRRSGLLLTPLLLPPSILPSLRPSIHPSLPPSVPPPPPAPRGTRGSTARHQAANGQEERIFP